MNAKLDKLDKIIKRTEAKLERLYEKRYDYQKPGFRIPKKGFKK